MNGAILQAMAVEFALSSDLSVTWEKFYKFLKVVIDKLEADNDDDDKYNLIKFFVTQFCCNSYNSLSLCKIPPISIEALLLQNE